jgi:hypothetical protein
VTTLPSASYAVVLVRGVTVWPAPSPILTDVGWPADVSADQLPINGIDRLVGLSDLAHPQFPVLARALHQRVARGPAALVPGGHGNAAFAALRLAVHANALVVTIPERT